MEIKDNYTEEEKFEDMESDKRLRALAQKNVIVWVMIENIGDRDERTSNRKGSR